MTRVKKRAWEDAVDALREAAEGIHRAADFLEAAEETSEETSFSVILIAQVKAETAEQAKDAVLKALNTSPAILDARAFTETTEAPKRPYTPPRVTRHGDRPSMPLPFTR